jgi:hypothetical protein
MFGFFGPVGHELSAAYPHDDNTRIDRAWNRSGTPFQKE